MDALRVLSADATDAAPKLLGWRLISHTAEGLSGGIIVEVEAYHGTEDPASHAFRGLTPRTAPMFAGAGAIYVYRSYGIHACVNLVTGPAGKAQAVLIRALEPTLGLDLMMSRRHQTNPRLLTTGPGNICQALGINVAQSGAHLRGSEHPTNQLELQPPQTPLDPSQIAASGRIGIRQAIDRPWRFYLANNRFVSRPHGRVG